MKVELSVQVAEFARRLAPEPRRALRRALGRLASGAGDIKGLEGPLQGYSRLRVGGYRVVFWDSARRIECVFAEHRSIVYEVFAESFVDVLARRGEDE